MADLQSTIIGSLLGFVCGYFLQQYSKGQDKQLADNLADKSQHFEIYKVIYARNFELATTLMSQSSELYINVHDHYWGRNDEETRKALYDKLTDLLIFAKTNEGMLGANIVNAVSNFRQVCNQLYLPNENTALNRELEPDAWEHETSYNNLISELRKLIQSDGGKTN